MPKDPIIPSRASRPGGRNLAGEPMHYMDALQNRNKTNLIDILGVAPPLVEEITPDTTEMFQAKSLILKSLKRIGHFAGQMSGLTAGLQNMATERQRVQQKYMAQFQYGIEDIFAPIQGLFRDVESAYIDYINRYPETSFMGTFLSSALSGIGMIYLGPVGATALGWVGQIVGDTLGVLTALGNTKFEQWALEGGYTYDPNNPGGTPGLPTGPPPRDDGPEPGGGMPVYPQHIITQETLTKRYQRQQLEWAINKITNLERLYR